jgi:hypothetical protein
MLEESGGSRTLAQTSSGLLDFLLIAESIYHQ